MNRPRVMGIVNVTPDSFSDGGRLTDLDAALKHARSLIAAGADSLDIGGESTRPGAEPVDPDEEIRRVIPLITAIRSHWDGPISIDTMKPQVARAAVEAGASIWNDVSALRFGHDSARTAADLGVPVALMHMQGEPRTMQDAPTYADVALEVATWLGERAQAAEAAGVRRDNIWLDPGIGFGKTAAHNLTLTRRLGELVALDYPVLYGASRKRVIQAVDSSATDPMDRLGGSLALALEAARQGAAVIRVHDVHATVQALKMQAALAESESDLKEGG